LEKLERIGTSGAGVTIGRTFELIFNTYFLILFQNIPDYSRIFQKTDSVENLAGSLQLLIPRCPEFLQ
jgi:hypothetical protein